MKTAPEQPHFDTVLHRAALVLAVALVIARATMTQSLRDPDMAAPGMISPPITAGPTTGLILDLLMCVPALLVLLRRLIDPSVGLTFTLSHGLLLLLATFAALSSFWASDKFAAAVNSAHFLSAAVLFWSMSQLVRTWAHVRLIAAVCFGILLICIAQGAIYRLVELPDLIERWDQTRLEEFARRGWTPDSFQARHFEIRVRAGELLGFNTSPNSFAAMIVMLSIIGAGAVIQRIVDRDEYGWPMAIIALMLPLPWVLYHTGSRAAVAAGILGAGVLAVSPWLKQRRAIYLVGVAACVIGAGVLIGYGLFHEHLIHPSLTFRWRYWTGAMRVFLEHPLAGVGWSSFGDYYPGARLPIASEEVKDPHNLIVRAFVEVGTIGGLLMLGWLARLAWELSSPVRGLEARIERRQTGMKLIAWIGSGALLVNVLASVDFSSDGAYTLIEIIKRLLFMVLALLGMGIVALRSSKEPWLDDRAAPWMLRAMGVGVGVFLVCNLVDFSMFEPGPMGVVAMIAGAAIGARTRMEPATSGSRIGPWTALAAAVLIWLAAAIGIAAPIAETERLAHEGDTLLRRDHPAAAAERLQRAFHSLWIPNPDYAHRSAFALVYAQAPAEQVRAMLESAVRANPMSTGPIRALAQHELRLPQPDPQRVTANYQRLLTLDPWNVPARLEFAAALARFGDRERAIEQYREALRIDDLLDPEEPKRLTPEQIGQIQRMIEAIQS